jgi:uncharacterized ferritin-like protein (DUF455 family)
MGMQTKIKADSLARDERFERRSAEERIGDLRSYNDEMRRMDVNATDVEERARRQMHGIFVGEIQALEGAGRTAFDFSTEEVPFELKLDMARQCWDEARHCEIAIILNDHMGAEIGEHTEYTTLFEAACHDDPVFRLCGVNRALEGLAIDVFNNMRDFGETMGDPIMFFCEDWMLADEVTHVKMGSKWLREVTKDDIERRNAALEFQRVVDGIFSLGGQRGDSPDAAIKLARRFREMAGFTTQEIDEIAEVSAEQLAASKARLEAASAG